jgi:hypothetical protein
MTKQDWAEQTNVSTFYMPQGVYLVLDCHYDRLINITIANCSRKLPSHIQFNSGNLMAIESKVTHGRVKTKQKWYHCGAIVTSKEK